MIEIQKRRIVVAFLLFFRRQFHIIAERHAQICVISDRNRQALVLERNLNRRCKIFSDISGESPAVRTSR